MKVMRPVALGVAAAFALIITSFVVPHAASAHGVTMFPGSRTFLCWQDGLTDSVRASLEGALTEFGKQFAGRTAAAVA